MPPPPLSIVAISFGLRIGGAEKLIVDWLIATKGDPAANAILILVNDDYDKELLASLHRNGIEVLHIGRRPGSRSLWPFLRLMLALWRLSPAIIQTHDYASHIIAVLAKFLLPGSRLFSTVQSTREAPKFAPWYRRAAAFLQVRFIAISAAVAADCEAHGLRISRIIGNGIQFAPYRRIYRIRPIGPAIRIVCVARLAPAHKGQDILLRALHLCRSRGMDATCTFMGGNSETNVEGRRELEALSRELGLSDSVKFLMDRTDIAAALDDSNLFVLPSRYEGFGIAIIEAMRAGLPVIASAVDGIPEIIQDGVTGFLVPPEDPEALAAKIGQVAALRDLAPLVTAAGLRAENYSIEVMRDRYIEAYSAPG